MRTIPLTQGKIALVDNADYEWLNRWRWCALKRRQTFYVVRHVGAVKGKRRLELMHRLILGLQPGDKRQCDHRDGNGLNNQISNLRFCTQAQNNQSARKQIAGTSKYKGIYWHQDARKWHSQIRAKGKQIYLGLFESEIDAATAYDKAALKYFDEFALTNTMLGLLESGRGFKKSAPAR